MIRLAVIAFLLFVCMTNVASSQDDGQPFEGEIGALADTQRIIRENYQSLLQRMRADLNSSDENQKQRIAQATSMMDRLQIEQDMIELEKMIQEKSVGSAAIKAKVVSEKLRRVLAILDGISDEWEKDRRIPTLEEKLNELKNLNKLQQELKNETDKLKSIPLSDADKAKLEELKDRQQTLQDRLDALKDILPDSVKPYLDEASKHMKHSQEELHKEKLDGSSLQQKKATEQMNQAEQRLESELKKYRDVENEQLLIHVLAQLKQLREGQVEVNKNTIQLHLSSESNRREWRALKSKQNGLQTSAQDLADKLIYGNVPVFGHILGSVSRDMGRIVELLGEQQGGEYTQDLQSEIILRLDDLIDALNQEKTRRDNKGEVPPQQTDPNGKNPEPRLVPLPAELQMLLKRQEYLRAKHERFLDRYPNVRDRADMTDPHRRIYERLSGEQGENARYLDALLDTLFKKQ